MSIKFECLEGKNFSDVACFISNLSLSIITLFIAVKNERNFRYILFSFSQTSSPVLFYHDMKAYFDTIKLQWHSLKHEHSSEIDK